MSHVYALVSLFVCLCTGPVPARASVHSGSATNDTLSQLAQTKPVILPRLSSPVYNWLARQLNEEAQAMVSKQASTRTWTQGQRKRTRALLLAIGISERKRIERKCILRILATQARYY